MRKSKDREYYKFSKRMKELSDYDRMQSRWQKEDISFYAKHALKKRKDEDGERAFEDFLNSFNGGD